MKFAICLMGEFKAELCIGLKLKMREMGSKGHVCLWLKFMLKFDENEAKIHSKAVSFSI